MAGRRTTNRTSTRSKTSKAAPDLQTSVQKPDANPSVVDEILNPEETSVPAAQGVAPNTTPPNEMPTQINPEPMPTRQEPEPLLKVVPGGRPDPVPFRPVQPAQPENKTAQRQSSEVYEYQGRYVRLVSMFDDMAIIKDGSTTKTVLHSELIPTGQTELKYQSGRINVNNCLIDDLMTLKNYGIRSRNIAGKIIENRQGGYRDFAHMRQLNSFLSSVNWNEIESHLCFNDEDTV